MINSLFLSHKKSTISFYNTNPNKTERIDMKKITLTVASLVIMSIGAYANSPIVGKHHKTLEQRKSIRVNKVNEKINALQKRKECISSATSLEQMQHCRPKRYSNKSFKLKQNMTLEQRKSKKLAKMNRHLKKLEAKKSCILNASTMVDLKKCKNKKRH